MGRQGTRPVIAHLAVALSLGLALSACGGSAGAADKHKGGSGGSLGSIEDPAGPGVTVVPADNATAVNPVTPVKVTTSDGTLDSVQLSNPAGQPVKGTMAADGKSWRSAEELGYNKSYKVAVTAHDDKGHQSQTSTSFTTLKPGNMTLPYLSPTGGTYGVGQPVIVRFDEPIPNRQAAEKSIQITTAPAVEGRFHWFNDHEVHWRPAEYWKPGTKVTVDAKVYGVNFGTDLWGQEDRSATFTIGPSRIAIADSNTKHMKVYINGAMVRDIPVSMGKGGTTTGANGQIVDFWTRSGPHVVTEKHPEVRMWSATFGIKDPKDPNYYDEKIKYAVRISAAGEYVHLADWNIWAHGVQNTSHGCINVGPSNAIWFYNTFGPGDVVDVKNTPKQLQPWDGIGDWTIPWSQW